MNSNIYFLSGLPRTGSTLLTSILSQNPKLLTGGNSALCQIMWDVQVSCKTTEQMRNTPEVTKKLLEEVPNIFYPNGTKHVIDKCRTWTLPANLELIESYITKTPKIIVMLRPLLDIVKSLVHVRLENGWEDPERGLLDEGSEPIMKALQGVQHAKSVDSGQFLFVQYEDLVSKTEETISLIYKFCDWDVFTHTYSNIKPTWIEYNEYDLVGLHDVRPNVGKRNIEVKLSDALYKRVLEVERNYTS